MIEHSIAHSIPQKSFLVRAIYDWCIACNYAPQLLVYYHPKCTLPKEYIDADNEVAFSLEAHLIEDLKIMAQYISFKAFFDVGVYTPENAADVYIPMACVKGIYEPQQGDGLMFAIDQQELNILNTAADTIKQEHQSPQPIFKRIK